MKCDGVIIVSLANAIVEQIDSIDDLNDVHRRGALLRSLMVYYIRAGKGYDDFKSLINSPSVAELYHKEEIEAEDFIL
jgi:hypothetical protein